MKQALTLLLLLLLLSCSNEKQEQPEKRLSPIDSIAKEKIIPPSYYYIDKNNIIHSKKNCYALALAENAVLGFKRISRNAFIADSSYYYCTKCINDSIYSSISYISDINQNKAKGTFHKPSIDSIGNYAYLESPNKNPLLHSVKDCPYITDTLKQLKSDQLRGYRGDNIYPCCVFCIDSIIYQQIKYNNKQKIPGWSLKNRLHSSKYKYI